MECPHDAQLFDPNSNSTQAFLRKLAHFQRWYQPIHGYVCVLICVFGIFTNFVHVAVLSRPNMRNSAVNCILTAVAVCDIGTMASYLIYIIHFVLRRNNSCTPTFTHSWLQFLLWHVVLSITLHTTSLWLAVAMAFIRRMTLRVTALNSQWQRPKFAWKLCLGIYMVVFVLCIPNMLVHEIARVEGNDWRPGKTCQKFASNYSEPVYTFMVSHAATINNCRLFKWNIWMIGILFKIIPCILLIFLSFGLVSKIRDAEKHRRKLTSVPSNASTDSKPLKKKNGTSDRTTLMLVVILLVFLITEFPQGIISILCAIFTTDVHRYLYFYIGDVLDLLSLVNSSVNFVLYCVMSSRYRQTFWEVIIPSWACGLWTTRRGSPTELSQLQLNNSLRLGRKQSYTPLATEPEPARNEYWRYEASVSDNQNSSREHQL
ncbi:G-protein coupled receptors family 1 profile domain-containing protein [Caenorhabditis elegans]|uniref:G-protein coupled receptors family 1 profile domain-containing protein n=1 Tax=Caenorhabditis elegans TaxID=6239 RepID=O16548_CAEEL|nr:G-protein coupled receptors family 1 profile domain-containing protein [Caenorhabditis elegans]CCD65612.1 G-protein coupled receptors family 1 profile domain-containing protein [Caenorhabditis elegans]|eukprot:NP_504431.2 DroMyoSuppressin Receptor related [Caenorhabditis elegans]